MDESVQLPFLHPASQCHLPEDLMHRITRWEGWLKERFATRELTHQTYKSPCGMTGQVGRQARLRSSQLIYHFDHFLSRHQDVGNNQYFQICLV